MNGTSCCCVARTIKMTIKSFVWVVPWLIFIPGFIWWPWWDFIWDGGWRGKSRMRLISKGPGCRVMKEVDRPSGLLARIGSGNMIQLALCHYMLCAWSAVCQSHLINIGWIIYWTLLCLLLSTFELVEIFHWLFTNNLFKTWVNRSGYFNYSLGTRSIIWVLEEI